VANQGGLSPSFATLRGDGAGSYDHLDLIPWGFLDPFYEAVVQGVEEAVANALVANEDMVGYRGHRTPALPRDRVAAVFESTR
jgi:D-aminopeptidase